MKKSSSPLVTAGVIPLVTVIIPCRNEESFIEKVLNSIITQDYPKDKLEILVVDGMSDDGTRRIIESYVKSYNFIQMIDNLKKIVPCALNEGIRRSKGNVIMRMDAHAEYPSNYVSRLVSALIELEADNVGGVWETVPGAENIKAHAIALAMSNPFGVGNAKYRLKTNEDQPFEVDTVPFGCYKREVFERIGYFDEELIRNQDNEFNERLKRNGGKIFLVPDIKIKYFARDTYTKLWKMFFQYGYFGPLVDKKLRRLTRIRRYVPSAFLLSVFLLPVLSIITAKILLISVTSLTVYFFINLICCVKITYKEKKVCLIPYLFYAFLVSHFSYGLGYLKGVLDFLFFKKKPVPEKIAITR